MHELTVRLDPATRQSLDDLADATGRRPEDIAQEAVRKYLDDEARRVRSVAERLGAAHADLLRRLGE
ncbi:CopG family ribbon-helix-helix protein [Streptomyces sp. NPDC055013]